MPDAAGVVISMQSTSLLYLLGSSMRKTLLSNGEPKCLQESNVMVANGRPLKDVSSSVSVVRKPE